MFGLFKRKHEEHKKSSTQLWLDTADEAYEFACKRRLTSGLGDFFISRALKYIMTKIGRLNEDSESLTTYKTTTFKKLKTKDGSIKYRRDVDYDDVQLSKYVSVPLGESYSEKWTLTDGPDFKVSEIEHCERKG